MEIESDIAQQEQTVRALEAQERQHPGSSMVSPERLRSMRDTARQERRHLREFAEQRREQTTHMRAIENETQYLKATEQVRKDAEDVEREMRVLAKYPADTDAVQAYEHARERMLDLRDRYEDLSKAIPADSPVREPNREKQISETFLRMMQMDEKQQEPEKMSLETYDSAVREIIAEIISLQSAFEYALKKGLTKAKLQMLHDGLDAAQERLQELDTRAEEPALSKERRALMGLINQMRKAYPMAMEQVAPEQAALPEGAGLTAVRGLHERVRATYASVQHTLTLEQRREMRVRIASLSSLVRRAEDEQQARVGAAVLAAVSRATELAPATAHAAAARFPGSMPSAPRKNPLASLVSAFRLK